MAEMPYIQSTKKYKRMKILGSKTYNFRKTTETL